ncbi:ComF family protein [Metabacillus lacus]|nr:phosphoribosyltransferase family protein [Metabacillus lacus]
MLQRNVSLFSYTPFMKEVLSTYKFRGDAELAKIFQPLMVKAYQQHFSSLKPLLLPIPLSPQRLYERGYNQSELLIAPLLRNSTSSPLIRISSEKQSKKTKKERMQVLPFKLSGQIPQRPILLIDDIYTTGATLHHTAKLLRDNGASEVYSLTLIRS